MDEVFDPARHRPLSAEWWNPSHVARAIGRIIEDFEANVQSDGTWPGHALDGGGLRRTLYHGAAGAIVGMRLLAEAGYPAKDRSEFLPRLYAAHLEAPDLPLEAGLQLGEIGFLCAAISGGVADDALRAQLVACMREILGESSLETTSGQTGMMHAALTLYERTGDSVWRGAFAEGARVLWESWRFDHERNGWFWTSDWIGPVRHYYCACHGLAGNAAALLRGAHLLDDVLPRDWIDTAASRSFETLERGALREDGELNWPVSEDESGARRLIQWCHGAPGVVAALGNAPAGSSPAARSLDSLLLEAGETIWRAGPVAKGSGLCHGTSGNGYAFLELYARTRDERWLARARAFAMHAIGQSNRARERYEQGRYTLWTGDAGLALYLDHCLRPERTAFPGLEIL